jgi:hypothetical protein
MRSLLLAPAPPVTPPGGWPDPLARSFDWRSRAVVVGPADQGGICGCCWDFASILTLQCAYAIKHKYRMVFSQQDVLDHSGAGSCAGGWWAFPYLESKGAVPLAADPYLGGAAGPRLAGTVPRYRVARWGYVASDGGLPSLAELKLAMSQHGPATVSVNATTRFLAYQGGIFQEANPPDPGNNSPVNHAVVAIGWQDDALVIENSWGPDWGENGFMRIRYPSNMVGYGAAWVDAE